MLLSSPSYYFVSCSCILPAFYSQPSSIQVFHLHWELKHHHEHHHHHNHHHNHHRVVCLATGPYPLAKLILHRLCSSAYSFNFQHLISWKSSSSCLSFLPGFTAPSVFPSITCFRGLSVRKVCPVLWAFLRFTVCRMFIHLMSFRIIHFW
jgi:hypothetical protein